MSTITAIIGGTGLTELKGPELIRQHDVTTDLGKPSGFIHEGSWMGENVLFLSRHGHPHALPPHKVNYRANLLALQQLGADRIIAVNAVGGIREDMTSGQIAIPDQIIDYTWGRESTFFDGEYRPLEYVDFTHPYDERLRQVLLSAARSSGIKVVEDGVYGATQGPRLESIAEIHRMERDGCDLVGMTGMPEAVLARELGIPYACLCLVVNPAAGKSESLITMADVQAVIGTGMGRVRDLIAASLKPF